MLKKVLSFEDAGIVVIAIERWASVNSFDELTAAAKRSREPVRTAAAAAMGRLRR